MSSLRSSAAVAALTAAHSASPAAAGGFDTGLPSIAVELVEVP